MLIWKHKIPLDFSLFDGLYIMYFNLNGNFLTYNMQVSQLYMSQKILLHPHKLEETCQNSHDSYSLFLQILMHDLTMYHLLTVQVISNASGYLVRI